MDHAFTESVIEQATLAWLEAIGSASISREIGVYMPGTKRVGNIWPDFI